MTLNMNTKVYTAGSKVVGSLRITALVHNMTQDLRCVAVLAELRKAVSMKTRAQRNATLNRKNFYSCVAALASFVQETDEEALAEAVCSYPCLWQTSRKKYKDLRAKNNALKEVALQVRVL